MDGGKHPSIHPSMHPSPLHPATPHARDNAHLVGRDAMRLGALGEDKRVGVADGVGPREERGDPAVDSFFLFFSFCFFCCLFYFALRGAFPLLVCLLSCSFCFLCCVFVLRVCVCVLLFFGACS